MLNDLVEVKKGKECHNCKKQFDSTDRQYHCFLCQVWFCEECGEKIDKSKKGSASLIHTHNMIWIDVKEGKLIKPFEKYKLGDLNKTFMENEKNRMFSCNGCGDGDETAYICLNCLPGMLHDGGFVDICEPCFQILKKKEISVEEKKKRDRIRKKLKDDSNHDNDSHLFLRVCFGDNYYDF